MAEIERDKDSDNVTGPADVMSGAQLPVLVGISDAPVSCQHDALDFAVSAANCGTATSCSYTVCEPLVTLTALAPTVTLQSGSLRVRRSWPSPPSTRASAWARTRGSGPS